MFKALLLRSVCLAKPFFAVGRQVSIRPILGLKNPPFQYIQQQGGAKSFTVMSRRMSIIDDRVKNIIVQQLGVAPAKVVNPASFTKDLGADQVGVTELFLALEEFEVAILGEETKNITTVQAVIDCIQSHQ